MCENQRKTSCCFVACLLTIVGIAQNIDATRFFSLNVQQLHSSQNLTNNSLQSYSVNGNDQNYLIDASLKFPIKLKGDFQLIGSLGYERESVFGLYAPSEDDGIDINLHSAQTSLIAIQKLAVDKRIISRFAWVSNSNEFLSSDPKATAWGTTVLYEKQKTDGKIGFGIAFGYCQKFSYLPLFSWQKNFRNGYGIDIFVPSRILLTKRVNQASRLYAGLKGQATGYFVENDQFSTLNNNANYRRISIQGVVGYERMINSLVGIECTLGLNIPYYSGIYTYEDSWQRLHDFNDRLNPQFKVGVFFAIDR